MDTHQSIPLSPPHSNLNVTQCRGKKSSLGDIGAAETPACTHPLSLGTQTKCVRHTALGRCSAPFTHPRPSSRPSRTTIRRLGCVTASTLRTSLRPPFRNVKATSGFASLSLDPAPLRPTIWRLRADAAGMGRPHAVRHSESTKTG